MKIMCVMICFATLLCGCQSEKKIVSQVVMPEKPKIDQSTPDNAVRSLWAVELYQNEMAVDNLKKEDELNLYSRSVRDWNIKEKSDSIAERKKTKRSIEKVEIQSESYSIVYVKAPESTSEPNIVDWKYILSKENGRWMVDNVLVFCTLCKGTGNDVFTSSEDNTVNSTKDKCFLCCGDGWRSLVFACRRK